MIHAHDDDLASDHGTLTHKQALVRIEALEGALRVIHTWATFEHDGRPAGYALDSKQVADLCNRCLGRDSSAKERSRPCAPGTA